MMSMMDGSHPGTAAGGAMAMAIDPAAAAMPAGPAVSRATFACADPMTGAPAGRCEVAAVATRDLDAVRGRPELAGFEWRVDEGPGAGIAIGRRYTPAVVVTPANADALATAYVASLRAARLAGGRDAH